MATLRTLPVRKLKIDRQFLAEATRQESAQQLLGKIIEISHVMGMSALTEGVETIDQRDLLIRLGCDHFQGYLFARPMPRQELDAWLATQRLPVALAGSSRRATRARSDSPAAPRWREPAA